MSRTCTICTHSDLGLIDAALVAGEAYRSVAKRFEASAPAVYRHQQDHLPVALAKAKEAGEVAHGDSLLDQLQSLQTKALAILARAEAAGDLRTALGAIREVRSTLELVAKITGEMRDKGDREQPVQVFFHIGKGYVDKPATSEVIDGSGRVVGRGYGDQRDTETGNDGLNP